MDTTFTDTLASSSPTPGGGGAAAYCGALAAALSQMVGALTVGKSTYASVEPQVKASMARLEQTRADLFRLIDDDARAFAPLAACYGMPRETEEEKAARDSAMQQALVGACEVPLSIMQACLSVLDDCAFMAQNGSKLAVSDAGASAVLAHAACKAASLNVFINIASLKDKTAAEDYERRAHEMMEQSSTMSDRLFTMVMKEIGQ